MWQKIVVDVLAVKMFSAAMENSDRPSSRPRELVPITPSKLLELFLLSMGSMLFPSRNCQRFYRGPQWGALLSSPHHIPKNQTVLGSHNDLNMMAV